ncbi:prephenate dehydrogenase/arogenate dehydrogenase family protein [Thermodesulfobacteriota bacterium]
MIRPQSIAIVGGMGRMGALTARFFSEAGYSVTAFGRSASGTIPWEEVAEHDVIVLSIPISTVEPVMRELGPITRKNGVVIDNSSVKAKPVQSMLQHCRGEVIGSHPLFGPATESMKDHIVFVCPARSNRWYSWFRSFLEDTGARVVEIDPEKHDRLMASVQVLRHLLLFCLGRSMMRLDYDMGSDLDVSGPWFSTIVGLLQRQLAQDPELYSEIIASNPHSDEVVKAFGESVEEMCALYKSEDRSDLVRMIEEIASYGRP